MFYKRFALAALVAVMPAVALACGDSPSSVDDDDDDVAEGMITAAVHDSSGVLPEGHTQAIPADSMTYDGTLSGSAQVEIFSDADGWLSLGDPTDVSFSIYCFQAAVVADEAVVPAHTYTQVRITLDGFVANVDAGAIIQGITYDSAKVVTLGTDAIVIEKTVTPFTVAEGATTSIQFDLNSELWMDAGVLTATTVDASEVQAATRFYVR